MHRCWPGQAHPVAHHPQNAPHAFLWILKLAATADRHDRGASLKTTLPKFQHCCHHQPQGRTPPPPMSHLPHSRTPLRLANWRRLGTYELRAAHLHKQKGLSGPSVCASGGARDPCLCTQAKEGNRQWHPVPGGEQQASTIISSSSELARAHGE